MRPIVAGIAVLALSAVALAQEVTEPRSGVTFAAKNGELSLLGVGLRTKTFLKVKVYAIGLYASDAAVSGSLAQAKPGTPAFYRELVSGDFDKQITMKFVRDLSADQIQGAFRETLEAADAQKVTQFVSYFGGLKVGQDVAFRWAPGGTLQTTVAGVSKPEIKDRKFAEAVFGIWLGEKPIQDDLKKDLVSRATQGN
jgi:hypothetical protein